MSAEIRALYEDDQRKVREEGREEGRTEGQRRLLLQQVRSRFGEPPAAAIARIEAADTAKIEWWAIRIFDVQTLAELLDEPS